VALENARLTDAVRAEQDERTRVIEAQGRAQATLGHELRSPLTSIQSYSALLLDGVFGSLNDRQRESVARIRMSGQHLLEIIESLLDVARIGAGGIELSVEDVSAADVVAEAVQMMLPLAHEKQHELSVGPIEGIVARADPSRLRQALVNLIVNAIKYTPERGRIRVQVSTEARDGRAFAAVRVEDNGRGMSADALATIFDPYDRGGAPRHEPGLGLGLFISREMLRHMGGDIEVESEPGVGSAFTALLPVAADAAAS
jgi:signal transduction histidine kinase